jgi:hypothetical protein
MRSAAVRLVTVALFLAGASLTTQASASAPADSIDVKSARPDSVTAGPEAILYYFHRTVRCHTCLTIEAYLDEELHTHFAKALEGGRLAWRPINIEEQENTHFEKDFSLVSNAAILVQVGRRGQDQSWKNLEAVWDLVESKKEFVEYIRKQVSAALGLAEAERDTTGGPQGAGIPR